MEMLSAASEGSSEEDVLCVENAVGLWVAVCVHKPDLFVEISTEDAMTEIEGILLPLGYERLHAFAGTPVWHFCHREHLSKMHQLELAAFKKVMRATRVPMRGSIPCWAMENSKKARFGKAQWRQAITGLAISAS